MDLNDKQGGNDVEFQQNAPEAPDGRPVEATGGDGGQSPPPKRSYFDKLRLTQDFGADLGVKKLITTVPVRKPGAQEWVRVHPDYVLPTAVLELKEERENYLVESALWPELGSELKRKELHVAITRSDTVFIWPVNVPGTDGRLDSWSMSALAAVEEAKRQWVRVKSNMNLGAYELYTTTATISEPKWPTLTFDEILQIAFKDRIIKSVEHPVVRHLLGLP